MRVRVCVCVCVCVWMSTQLFGASTKRIPLSNLLPPSFLFPLHVVVRIKPSSTSYHVLEDAGHVEVCVTMLGLAERPVNITLETVNGTAKG